MCDAMIGEPRFGTVIVTLTFCRVESNVTVAFPKPELEHGGTSCPGVSTAPRVCADMLPANNRAIEKLMKKTRRVISPPVVGEILPLLQIIGCKFCVTLKIRDLRHSRYRGPAIGTFARDGARLQRESPSSLRLRQAFVGAERCSR